MPEQDDVIKGFAFFSVDIVDSAAYKNRFINEWNSDFKSFFEAFPTEVNALCNNFTIPRHETLLLPCPVVWKFLGDEILFYVDITEVFDTIQGQKKSDLAHYELILYYAILFRRALQRYNDDASERLKVNKHAFFLKGAAWFANVPSSPKHNEQYGNTETQLRGKDHLGQRDFIGRQIDIGFRIAKNSTSGRFTISVEFAILLLRDNYLTIEDEGIKLYYEGRKPIRGILEHVNYPILQMDMNDRFNDSEDALLLTHPEPANQIALMRFLEEYVKRTHSILYYPFINEKDRLFRCKPFHASN